MRVNLLKLRGNGASFALLLYCFLPSDPVVAIFFVGLGSTFEGPKKFVYHLLVFIEMF